MQTLCYDSGRRARAEDMLPLVPSSFRRAGVRPRTVHRHAWAVICLSGGTPLGDYRPGSNLNSPLVHLMFDNIVELTKRWRLANGGPRTVFVVGREDDYLVHRFAFLLEPFLQYWPQYSLKGVQVEKIYVRFVPFVSF